MNKIYVLFLFLFLTHWTFAQTNVIKGTVRDGAGLPLPGVNIIVKGTSNGVATDADGTFQISASEGTLVISFIGYKEQEISISGRTTIDIILEEDLTTLEEVVVIGYGTQKKKDLTTSVAIVDEASLKDRPLVSAAEALQGKAAGVQVIQTSGKPGGDIAIRIRGATSVLAGNEPLYVVDGMQTMDIKGLNPSDISSMTVLKDASAAAIYGARAANGVVLITTKRGTSNSSFVRFNAYSGISNLSKTVETLSTKQYRTLLEEMNIPVDPAATGYTNWSDLVFGTGVNQSYQLAIGGGNEKSQFYLSANYLQNKGIVAPATFDRFSVRLNLDNQVKEWLKIGTNLNLLSTTTKNTNDNTGADRGGIILSVLNTPPFLKPYKSDGSGQFDPNPYQASWENPYAGQYGPDQEAVDSRLFGNLTAEAKIIKGLTYKTNIGIDYTNYRYDYYLDPFRTNFGRSQHGYGQANRFTSTTYLIENYLTYIKSVKDHNLTALVGTNISKNYLNDSYIQGNDFPNNVEIKTLNAANNISYAATNITESSLVSFFGRVNYDYKGKYLFGVTVKTDGSSKLAKHWGTMPAFSAAWRISSEPFMQQFGFINDLKIRGGWGRSGNQDGISNYARYGLTSYSRRAPTNPLSGPAETQTSYGNPNLQWETTDQTNIGLDLSILQARVIVTLDAYIKQTSNVLLDVQLPQSVGSKVIQTNAANIENRGLELNISTVNMENKFQWKTDFNISFNRNKVTSLGDYAKVYFFGNFDNNFLPVNIVREGLPLGAMYGYISDGVKPETGDIQYRDLNNNGIFDTADRTIIGNGQPNFIFGFTNNFSYKRFDLSLFFQGSVGNDIFNANRIALEGMFDSKNQSKAVLRRWTPTNKITDIPRASQGNFDNVRNSSRFVEDGSYVRLKSVTLTYNFNTEKIKKWGIKKMSVYTTGQNLLTFTKYSGFDPEVNAFGRSATEVGIDYGTYPQARTITLGLNVEF